MSESFKSQFKKWVMLLIIPALTIITGYLVFTIEHKVMGSVKADYVSKPEFKPVAQKVEENTQTIKVLQLENQQNKVDSAVIKNELLNIRSILTEIREDVKQVKNNQ